MDELQRKPVRRPRLQRPDGTVQGCLPRANGIFYGDAPVKSHIETADFIRLQSFFRSDSSHWPHAAKIPLALDSGASTRAALANVAVVPERETLKGGWPMQ